MTHRVVIHPGFHKTGTTSLQASLQAHAVTLGPQVQVQTRKSHAGLAHAADLARAWSISRDSVATARLAAALQSWAADLRLAPGQVLLVSCEDLSGHMPGHRGLPDYAAAPSLARALADALAQRFGPALDLRFLFTTRAATPWLRSVHWQLANHPMMELSADKFARRFAKAAAFAPLLDAVRAMLPGVPVVEARLEDLAECRLGPVTALYELAGLDSTALMPVAAANQRPPHDLAEVFVAMNRTGMAPTLLAEMKRRLIALSDAAGKTLPSPPPRG